MPWYFSPSTKGFFSTAIHGESLPLDAIEIGEEARSETLLAQSQGKIIQINEGQLIASPPPPRPVNERRSRAMRNIDEEAGAARLRYVSAGQLIEEEYRQALIAVREWRTAGSPADVVPPEIVSGAAYSGITNEAAAVEIEQTAVRWEDVLSAIRDLRLGGKAAVKLAADTEIESVAQGYIEQLDAMAPVLA